MPHAASPVSLPAMFTRPSPWYGVRGVHLDLKGLPPTFDVLMQWLDAFHALRLNAVLVEWEDQFPWTFDERCRSATCYTPQQVRDIASRSAELGIELIPLIPCLGHLEFVLAHDDYASMRELPGRIDCLNPLHEGAAPLVHAMIDDVLALLPGTRRLHLGGDEAYAFGQSDAGRRYVQQHGGEALYLHHVRPLCQSLAGRGVRPMLWHDMMIHWQDDALQRMGELADVMVWGYHGTPWQGRHHHRLDVLERLYKLKLPLWGAGAFKGASGHSSMLPDPATRLENAAGWARAAADHPWIGCIATGWSRYNTNLVQVEPMAVAWDMLLAWALVLHDGELPDAGLAACLPVLGQALHDHHVAAKRLAESFDQSLKRVAGQVMKLHEQAGHLRVDPTRRRDAMTDALAKPIPDLLAHCRQAGDALAVSLSCDMPPRWAERFVQARLSAIDSLAALGVQAYEALPYAPVAASADTASPSPTR